MINSTERDQLTPLHFAAMNGHIEIIKFLLSLSSPKTSDKPNNFDNDNQTPANIKADSNNNQEPTQTFQNKEESQIAQNKETQNTEESKTIENDDTQNTDENKTTENKETQNTDKNKTNENNDTQNTEDNQNSPNNDIQNSNNYDEKVIDLDNISETQKQNQKENVPFVDLDGESKIVKIEINAVDFQGMTPLFHAVHNKHNDIVKLLLDNGADPNIATKNLKRTCVIEAVINEDLKIVSTLCNCERTNVFLADANQWTPVHFASQLDQFVILEAFEDNDFESLFAENNLKQTPFEIAVLWDKGESYSFFMDKMILEKIDINHQDIYGNTVLHNATRKGNIETVIDLLNIDGIDPKIKNIKGQTPLHISIDIWSYELMEELAMSGECDMNAKDNNGLSPLLLATKLGNSSIVKFLIGQQSVDCSMTDNQGNTALHIAAQLKSPDILKLLLKSNKFDINQQNSQKQTPEQIATHFRHLTTVKIIHCYIEEGLESQSESDSSDDKRPNKNHHHNHRHSRDDSHDRRRKQRRINVNNSLSDYSDDFNGDYEKDNRDSDFSAYSNNEEEEEGVIEYDDENDYDDEKRTPKFEYDDNDDENDYEGNRRMPRDRNYELRTQNHNALGKRNQRQRRPSNDYDRNSNGDKKSIDSYGDNMLQSYSEDEDKDQQNAKKSSNSDGNKTKKEEEQSKPLNKKNKNKKRFQPKRISRNQHAWKRRNENKVVDVTDDNDQSGQSKVKQQSKKIPIIFDDKDSIGHIMSENDDSLDEFKKIEAESMQIDGSTPVFYDLQDIDDEQNSHENK